MSLCTVSKNILRTISLRWRLSIGEFCHWLWWREVYQQLRLCLCSCRSQEFWFRGLCWWNQPHNWGRRKWSFQHLPPRTPEQPHLNVCDVCYRLGRSVCGGGGVSLLFVSLSPSLRLVDVGKPVVVVLTHGAPVVSSVYASVSAVLSAGYAGQGRNAHSVLRSCRNDCWRKQFYLVLVPWYACMKKQFLMCTFILPYCTFQQRLVMQCMMWWLDCTTQQGAQQSLGTWVTRSSPQWLTTAWWTGPIATWKPHHFTSLVTVSRIPSLTIQIL